MTANTAHIAQTDFRLHKTWIVSKKLLNYWLNKFSTKKRHKFPKNKSEKKSWIFVCVLQRRLFKGVYILSLVDKCPNFYVMHTPEMLDYKRAYVLAFNTICLVVKNITRTSAALEFTVQCYVHNTDAGLLSIWISINNSCTWKDALIFLEIMYNTCSDT